MPAAGTSTVDAPSVENVIVDAPVVGANERAVVDYSDINANGVQTGFDQPQGNAFNQGFTPQQSVTPNQGFAQEQSVTPNQSFAQEQSFTQNQGYSATQGYGINQGTTPNPGYTQSPGYGTNPGFSPSSENFGYDYGYNKDIQEYGQPSYVPEGFYSNDPFSSYYYEDEQPAPKSNGMAIAALVLGIASLTMFFSCIGWIPGIIAIPLGITGLSKCRSKGMARAGMIMGIIGTFAGLGYLLYYIIKEFV